MLIGEYLSKTDTETLAKLIQYQWMHYSLDLLASLEIEKQPVVTVSGVIEDTDEIDRLMRKAPESRRALDD